MARLLPEGLLLITALAVLIYDFIKIIPGRVLLMRLALGGLILSLLAWLGVGAGSGSYFSNFYLVDSLALFFKGLFLLVGVGVVLLNYNFFAAQVKRNEGEFYFLFLTSLLGLMFMASSPHLLMIYLGLELVGLTCYLLSGWQKTAARSAEASVKYFLFGALASALFLYGVSLFYGLTGTFDLSRITAFNALAPLNFLALLFMVLGFGFKITMFPMQFWCPDVYEGAPTPITAYLSVGPKAAGFALLLRFLILLKLDFILLFAVLSVLTMTWGNLVALRQNNIKRLLAYSSIAQAGYIMIGLVSPAWGYPAILFYLLAYTLANLGVFAVVIYLSSLLGSEELANYAGFARRSPFLAAALSVFFLSLIGIPPLAGFVGKFLVFQAAAGSGFLWLAALGVINSVVSVYYYMNIVQIMYFRPGAEQAVTIPRSLTLVTWLCLGATILLGIFPTLILQLIS